MEAGLIVIGVLLGWGITQAALTVRGIQARRTQIAEARRRLYAAVLATSDTCYGLMDFMVTWPRRMPTGEGSRSRTPTRAAAVINAVSADLDANVRRLRELMAELQLGPSADAISHATMMRDSLEEAALALRMDTPSQLTKRWEGVIAPGWRSSRDAFLEAVRSELGDR